MNKDVTVVAPPRPPSRRSGSRIQSLIIFVGFWAAIVWGLNAFSDRYGWRNGVSASALLMLAFGALIALAGPKLGVRRAAAFLVGVPIIGTGIQFLVTWRIAGLPDRYWSGTTFPRRWAIGWTVLAVFGVTFMAASIGSAAPWTLQPQTREAAIAQGLRRGGTVGGLPVVDRRALMTFRRGARTLVVEEIVLSKGHAFATFWVRPGSRKSDPRWVVDRREDVPAGWLCLNEPPTPFCVLRVNEKATAVHVTFFNQPAVNGVALNGVALIWVGLNAQIKGWQSFDPTGALLETQSQ